MWADCHSAGGLQIFNSACRNKISKIYFSFPIINVGRNRCCRREIDRANRILGGDSGNRRSQAVVMVLQANKSVLPSRETPPRENLQQLTKELLHSHGELMSGPALYRALGFKSAGRFRQSLRCEPPPIPVFQLPQRRGYFALTRDAADWLYRQRVSASDGRNSI